MAALRNGMSTVILPEDNVKDLEEIDPLVRESLKFIPVSQADQVLACALVSDGQPPKTPDAVLPPEAKTPGTAVNLCQ